MTAIDHKAEATSLLINVESAHSHDVRAQWLAEAQVHATLALVEQQRLANVIAYWQLHIPRSAIESYESPLIEVHQIDVESDRTLDDQIREGLALS